MAAHGRVRAKARVDAGRYAHAARTLSSGKQPIQFAGCQRPGFYRYAGHRVWTSVRKIQGKGFLGRGSGCECVCPLHRAISRHIQSLEFSEISFWRKLRNHAFRGVGQHPAKPEGNRSEWCDAAVAGVEFWGSPGRPEIKPRQRLPYELALPTYAATAAYHHKLPQQPADLHAFLKEVEAFATGDYAHALWEGNQISETEKRAVAEKLHGYTGLPAAYWMKANLRVSGGNFEKTLQDDEDVTTGRLDARFSGPTLDLLSEESQYDPQSAALTSAYLSLFNQYVRQVLKYGDGQTYLPEALFAGYNWDNKHTQPGDTPSDGSNALNVMPDLATAMKKNPQLKVLLNAGYYDLATPFFAATYEEQHLPIESSLTKKIEYDYYESGHMVYARDESLHRLHDNAAAFIRSTENPSK